MEKKYCNKCDLEYFASEQKGIKDCPFCSLGINFDNLSYKEKSRLRKNNNNLDNFRGN